MSDNKQSPSEITDGFDFIEYPCDYNFKAMCRVAEGHQHEQELRDIVVSQLDEKAILSSNSTSSRTGKYESITLTVRLTNREQLTSIYQAIAESPSVVMTL